MKTDAETFIFRSMTSYNKSEAHLQKRRALEKGERNDSRKQKILDK